jgi:hypothetical protein
MNAPFYRFILIVFVVISCSENNSKQNSIMSKPINIAFLHHSTGGVVDRGNTSKIYYKLFEKGDVSKYFSKYNKENGTKYNYQSIIFPKKDKYGWNNYPFDYYNIWVKHAGETPYNDEPTLELLTQKYNIIIFKHCYPIGDIIFDKGQPDVDSDEKRIENYKEQYLELKRKLHTFPQTKFLVWTGAALVQSKTTPEKAQKVKEFFEWVKHDWDEPDDNIFIWDFFELETEGGLYFKNEYASAPGNSHPSVAFGGKVAPFFCKRIIDVIQGKADNTSLTGR